MASIETRRALLLLSVYTTASALMLPPPPSVLERLRSEHAAELADSAELGYARAHGEAPTPLPDVSTWPVAPDALGMGAASPFEADCHVVATRTALLSGDECAAIVGEAAAHLAAGRESSSFTMTDTNRDVAVHELPKTQAWINRAGLHRVASLAARAFPSAVRSASSLYVYRSLVIHYDAAAGLTHQPLHRDGSLISCTIPLNGRGEYCGGGTLIEPLRRAVVLDRGHALLHPSAVRHAGPRQRPLNHAAHATPAVARALRPRCPPPRSSAAREASAPP